MLKEYNVIKFPNLGGDNVEMEINFNSETDAIRVKVGDKTGIISKQDIYPVIFVIADPENQSKLMPVQKTEIRKYIKQHRVKLLKNMKKGEEMVVNCEVDVPLTIEQNLRGLIDKKKNKIVIY